MLNKSPTGHRELPGQRPGSRGARSALFAPPSYCQQAVINISNGNGSSSGSQTTRSAVHFSSCHAPLSLLSAPLCRFTLLAWPAGLVNKTKLCAENDDSVETTTMSCSPGSHNSQWRWLHIAPSLPTHSLAQWAHSIEAWFMDACKYELAKCLQLSFNSNFKVRSSTTKKKK